MPPDSSSLSTGSRKVEPPRHGKRGKGSAQRRKARRAIAKAVRTAEEIQGTARARQKHRAAAAANTAAKLTGDLDDLYEEFNGNKREIFATGLVPDGTEYRGRTARFAK